MNSRNEPPQAQPPGATVTIDSVRVADSPRISGENHKHTHMLAESGAKLPPIVVHRTTMCVIDGVHRLRAAILRGEEKIDVQFFDGDQADAFVLAVEANVAHGLPLSLVDRRAAAVRITKSHPHWSDRVIAHATGLSHKTIGAIRHRHGGEILHVDARVGHDGRTYPLNSADGRRRASELLRDQPSAPLRQIAVQAGISAETARDVRRRIDRHEDPIPPQQHRDVRRAASPAPVAPQPPSRGRGTDSPRVPVENLAPIVRKLHGDPSLRLNDTGRALLRLLDLHVMDVAQWERIVENIPRHRVSTVVDAAQECADAWQRLADQLARRHGFKSA